MLYASFNMQDSFGDGWNGSVWTLYSSSGDVLFSATLQDGYAGIESICSSFPSGDYTIIVTGKNPWPYEVSWSVEIEEW